MNSIIFGAVAAIVVSTVLGHHMNEWQWWVSIVALNAAHELINIDWR